MSFVTCPCGFRADGFATDAMAAYRAHRCPNHEPEPATEANTSSGDTWPGTVAFIALLVAVVAVCLICAGWRS